MGASKTKPYEDSPALMLPSDCSVRAMTEIVNEARRKISVGKSLILDASAVETADVTFVQFVVSAQKLCEAQSSPFRLENASAAALSAFARAGVLAPQATSTLGAH